MAKIVRIRALDGEIRYGFRCPGCGEMHVFWTKAVDGGPVWQFNGDTEKPTVRPSILVTGSPWQNYRCHMFVKDGRIQFLEDCTHDLRGKTVDMVDFED